MLAENPLRAMRECRRPAFALRRTCAVNEIAPDIWRDVKVGKGEQHVMQSRVDPAIRTTHLCHRIGIECVLLTGT
jgi:hypothetical protein